MPVSEFRSDVVVTAFFVIFWRFGWIICVRMAYPPGLLYDPNMFDEQGHRRKQSCQTNLETAMRVLVFETGINFYIIPVLGFHFIFSHSQQLLLPAYQQ